MTFIGILILVAVLGLVGGLVRGFIDSEGLVLPEVKQTDVGRVLRLGFVGSAVVGAVAAALSFAMYGPLANVSLITGQAGITYGISLSAAAGLVLVGFSGAYWLNSEAKKKLMQATAATAAQKPSVSQGTKDKIRDGRAYDAYVAIQAE